MAKKKILQLTIEQVIMSVETLQTKVGRKREQSVNWLGNKEKTTTKNWPTVRGESMA